MHKSKTGTTVMTCWLAGPICTFHKLIQSIDKPMTGRRNVKYLEGKTYHSVKLSNTNPICNALGMKMVILSRIKFSNTNTHIPQYLKFLTFQSLHHLRKSLHLKNHFPGKNIIFNGTRCGSLIII